MATDCVADLHISLDPPREHFEYLIAQLDEHGFYDGPIKPHDRRYIVESFESKGFIALYLGDKPIGLSTWTKWKRFRNSCEIGYKWLIPAYRRKGYGKIFAEKIYDALRTKRFYYILVEPATPAGNAMALKLGFSRVADTPYHFSTRFWYRYNKDRRKAIQPTKEGYELLIGKQSYGAWETNFYQCYKLDDGLSRLPILTTIDNDSLIKLTKDGEILKSNVAKRFFSDKEFQNEGFLYISTPLSKFLKKHKLGEKE